MEPEPSADDLLINVHMIGDERAVEEMPAEADVVFFIGKNTKSTEAVEVFCDRTDKPARQAVLGFLCAARHRQLGF